MSGEPRGEVRPSDECIKPEAPDVAQEYTCNTAPNFDYAVGETLDNNQLAAGPNSQLAISIRTDSEGASSPAAKQLVIPIPQAGISVPIRSSPQAQHGDTNASGGVENEFDGMQAIPVDTDQLPLGLQLRLGSSSFEPGSTLAGLGVSPGAVKAPAKPYARSIDNSDLTGDGLALEDNGKPSSRLSAPITMAKYLELPDVPRKPGVSTEKSEITDLGIHMIPPRRRTSSSLYEAERPLQSRLADAMEKAPRLLDDGREQWFLPHGKIDTIIDERSVKKSLRKRLKLFNWMNRKKGGLRYHKIICGSQAPMTAVDGKPKQYKRVYAVLILTHKPKEMPCLIEEGVCDADLPLRKVDCDGEESLGRRPRGGGKIEALPCFKKWNCSGIEAFEHWQWSVVAPYFASDRRGKILHYPLDPSAVLPFTSCEELGRPGGSARVFKVNIHPGHHDFGTLKDHFAVKILRPEISSKEHFVREVEMLKKFSGSSSHSHLVSLLATYEQGGRYHLIFPCARADLLGFWEKERPRHNRCRETSAWISQQCAGIADGLAAIHRRETDSPRSIPETKFQSEGEGWTIPTVFYRTLFGRHGDIKAANILWYTSGDRHDRGILKISDFGLAEFHRQNLTETRRTRGSRTYMPPESDFYDSMVVTGSFDIWALGCLFLEFITWYLGGSQLLQSFVEKRQALDATWANIPTDNFFDFCPRKVAGERVPRVKPSVTEFISSLHSHPKCTDFEHEMLDLVEQRMLVIVDRRQQSGRISARETHLVLQRIEEKCWKYRQYTVKCTRRDCRPNCRPASV